MSKPKVSVHKFTSCDGCQLAFLNAGEALLVLSELVELVHFAEAGPINPEEEVEIAFIEGSISTPHELERILSIREKSQYLVCIGACATAGGLQALRNAANHQEWIKGIYAQPEYIHSLAKSNPISEHVKVDAEVWGCPINTEQLMTVCRSLLFGVEPTMKRDSVCCECKRSGTVCVMVSQKKECMGPVTQVGCGALCPKMGRGCYGCYGPQQNPNTSALITQFRQMGLSDQSIQQHFSHINNQAPAFAKATQTFKGIPITHEQKD